MDGGGGGDDDDTAVEYCRGGAGKDVPQITRRDGGSEEEEAVDVIPVPVGAGVPILAYTMRIPT